MSNRGHQYLTLAQSLFNTHGGSRLSWVPVARLVLPRLLDAAVLAENESPASDSDKRVCHVATEAVRKLASAHCDQLTPIGNKWYRWAPFGAPSASDDRYKQLARALAVCSDIGQEEIELSNFYSEIIAVFEDRVGAGTGLLFTDIDKNNRLYFLHIPVGSYAIAENNYHDVVCVVRKFKQTPAQMADEFGLDNMPPDAQKQYADEQERYKVQRVVIHVVQPRKNFVDSDNFVVDPLKRRFESVYVDEQSGEILSEGGYYEFPYMCTRFLREGNQVYGTSPLLDVQNAIKDLISLDAATVSTAQRAAIPAVLVPPDMVGQLDFRAGAQVPVPPQYLGGDMIRPLAPPTDLRTVMLQREKLVEEIRSALFIPMLEVMRSVDRTMSATEATLRQQESIMTFTQSFTQCVADFRPMLNRIFSLLYRAGKFPAEVDRYLVQQEEGSMRQKIQHPVVTYNGRMAQAFERTQMQSAQNAMVNLVQLGSALNNPKLTMIFDFDAYARDLAISSGMPGKFLLSPDKVDAMYAELMAQQEQQMQQEMALRQSEARMNNADADSKLASMAQ